MIFKICILKSNLCTYKFHDCWVNLNEVMADFRFYKFGLCYLFENFGNVKADIR